MRDLVALSAFPAVCVGYAPLQTAESLADALRHMLNLDFLYLAVKQGTEGTPLGVIRTSQGPAPPDRVQEVRESLDHWLRFDSAGAPSTIPDPFGSGTIPIVLTSFGFAASSGCMVAGSRRADYPTEYDRLLLHVGANQLASLLGHRQAEEAVRLANARLDLAFRSANIVIVELNMPDGVPENGRWEWVSARDRIAGHDRFELPTDFAFTMSRLHPDDRERVLGALRAHLAGQTSEFEVETRTLHKDGSYIWRLAAVWPCATRRAGRFAS